MESFGFDISSVVVKLNLINLILIGLSMGGAVILEAEKLIFDRTIGLIAVDSLFPKSHYSTKMNDEDIEKTDKPFKKNFSQAYTDLIKQLSIKEDNQDYIKNIEIQSKTFDARALISSYSELMKWDFNIILGSINKPINCIISTITLKSLELTKDKFNKYFEVIYIENVGHLMTVEHPNIFNQYLEGILNEIIN